MSISRETISTCSDRTGRENDSPCPDCGQPMVRLTTKWRCKQCYSKGRSRRKNALPEGEQTLRQCARGIVSAYKHRGILKEKPCENCGDLNVQAHHDDYSKPLEVRWLCQRCHREHHEKNGISQQLTPVRDAPLPPGTHTPLPPVAEQIEQRRAGKRRAVRHGGALCSGCYAEPPLFGQRYGRNCHNKANRELYHRQQKELRRLRELEKKVVYGQENHGQSST